MKRVLDILIVFVSAFLYACVCVCAIFFSGFFFFAILVSLEVRFV